MCECAIVLTVSNYSRCPMLTCLHPINIMLEHSQTITTINQAWLIRCTLMIMHMYITNPRRMRAGGLR